MVQWKELLCDLIPSSSTLIHAIPGPWAPLLFLRHTKHPSAFGLCISCSPCLEHTSLSHMAHSLSPKLQYHFHHLHLLVFYIVYFYLQHLMPSKELWNTLLYLANCQYPRCSQNISSMRSRDCLSVPILTVYQHLDKCLAYSGFSINTGWMDGWMNVLLIGEGVMQLNLYLKFLEQTMPYICI